MELVDILGPVTGAGSIVDTFVALATSAVPYIVAVFTFTTGLAVGLALLTRTKKSIVATVKG